MRPQCNFVRTSVVYIQASLAKCAWYVPGNGGNHLPTDCRMDRMEPWSIPVSIPLGMDISPGTEISRILWNSKIE
jgi:hypothetical protein